MLSNKEKIEIINQHLRSIEYSLYNAELDKLEASAVSEIDTSFIASVDERINSYNAKVKVLEKEKTRLAEEA